MKKEKFEWKEARVGHMAASSCHELSVPVFAFADVLGPRKGQVVPARMDERRKGLVKGGRKD